MEPTRMVVLAYDNLQAGIEVRDAESKPEGFDITDF